MEGGENKEHRKVGDGEKKVLLPFFILLGFSILGLTLLHLFKGMREIERNYAETGKKIKEQEISALREKPLKTLINPREGEVVVEYCSIKVWNMIPPDTPSHEELKEMAKAEVEKLKEEVEANGGELEDLCERKKKELEKEGQRYPSVYFVENVSRNRTLFNEANEHADRAVQEMSVGDFKILHFYDGEYVGDDIEANDKTYISDYSLLKRIQ